jgi:acetyl esterase
MLNPQSREVVAEYDAELKVYDPGFDIAAARSDARKAAAAMAREQVIEARDLDADGVPCRLYRPILDDGPEGGVILHLHGGGFVFNDIDVHDAAARRLANRSGMVVLSVDYRRPPEHRFPAAPDDVDTVLGWLDRESAALGIEGPAFVHGDSAGGNLALVAALRNPGRFAAVVLIYPFLDPAAGYASYTTAADGFSAQEAEWYWQQYAASPADLQHPDLAPLRSTDLHTLPPTLIVTAEHDPLRDEGEDLAARLAELGVEVVGTRYLGLIHGFWRHDTVFEAAEPLMRQVVGFLHLHG